MSDDMISVLAKQSEELIRQDAEIASLRAAVLEICQVAVEKDRQCKVLARENERLRIGALTIAGGDCGGVPRVAGGTARTAGIWRSRPYHPPPTGAAHMSDLIKNVAEAMQWTPEEARNFLGHFIADDPEQLRTDLEAACEWAREAEKKAALIDVMKTMPAGSMTARWNGGDMTIGLSPERVEDSDG